MSYRNVNGEGDSKLWVGSHFHHFCAAKCIGQCCLPPSQLSVTNIAFLLMCCVSVTQVCAF